VKNIGSFTFLVYTFFDISIICCVLHSELDRMKFIGRHEVHLHALESLLGKLLNREMYVVLPFLALLV